MYLSRETRYALEALMVLAERPADAFVDSREIAAEADVPAPFLAKILRELARGGVVNSKRGHGFALARPANAITLGEILQALEGPGLFDNRCIFWREECSVEEPCVLHFRWKDLKPEIESHMSRLTLAEIRST